MRKVAEGRITHPHHRLSSRHNHIDVHEYHMRLKVVTTATVWAKHVIRQHNGIKDKAAIFHTTDLYRNI